MRQTVRYGRSVTHAGGKKKSGKAVANKPKKETVVVPSEEDEQTAFVNYLDVVGKRIIAAGFYFAIPNGAKYGANKKLAAIMAAKMKKTGMKNGVPDLFIPLITREYGGLFVEMKRTKGGVLSKEQKQWIRDLNKIGYKAVVAKGCAAAIAAFEQYVRGEY